MLVTVLGGLPVCVLCVYLCDPRTQVWLISVICMAQLISCPPYKKMLVAVTVPYMAIWDLPVQGAHDKCLSGQIPMGWKQLGKVFWSFDVCVCMCVYVLWMQTTLKADDGLQRASFWTMLMVNDSSTHLSIRIQPRKLVLLSVGFCFVLFLEQRQMEFILNWIQILWFF